MLDQSTVNEQEPKELVRLPGESEADWLERVSANKRNQQPKHINTPLSGLFTRPCY